MEFEFPEPYWVDEYRVEFGSLAFKLVDLPDGRIRVIPYLKYMHATSKSYTEMKAYQNEKQKARRKKQRAADKAAKANVAKDSPLVARAKASAKRDALAREARERLSVPRETAQL